MASLPVGIVLLISYLHDEGAPLPAADNSIGVLLSLVCVIFLFLTLMLTSIFLLPTFPKVFSNSKSETISDPFHGKKNSPTRWQRFRQIGKNYCLRFGPFLSFLLFFFFWVGLIENHGWVRWIGPTISFVASLVCYWWFCYVPGQFDDVVLSSINSLFSFFALFLVILAIIEQVNPNTNAWFLASIGVGVSLAIHAFMVTVVTDRKGALAFYFVILVWLSIIGPGLGFLGGLTLRYIGVSGGIPVSIRVKAYGRTGTVSGVDEVTGCLVLMTGGDVLIRPTDRILDCKLHPQIMGEQSLRPIATYSRVERYARADVLRVSTKFPDSCGTVDGLPIC